MPNQYIKDIRRLAREQVKEYFKGLKFLQVSDDRISKRLEDSGWKGQIICGNVPVKIIIYLPKFFPDVLPKIYLTDEFNYYPIPHVDRKKFVCTYSNEHIDFFAENPIGLVERSIEKAREIITSGIKKDNENEFILEFTEYWKQESNLPPIYSIFSPGPTPLNIKIAFIDNPRTKIECVAGFNEDQIIKYFNKLDQNIKFKTFKSSVYLPLSTTLIPPYPENNFQLIQYLIDHEPRFLSHIFSILESNSVPKILLFSVTINNTRVFFATELKFLIPNGFRKKITRRSLPVLLKSPMRAKKIERISVSRIDSDRIQERIGNKPQMVKEKKVCIIGCGSVGSHILFSLAKAGIEKFILVDNDILSEENIARHLCGMNFVGQNKVEALATFMGAHFPFIEIKPLKDNILEVLENTALINQSDLIISSIGNVVVERRLNQVHMIDPSIKALLYSWIEVFGIASHAILILRGSGGCLECSIDKENLTYKYQYAETRNFEDKVLMQELGCRTTFLPYSAIEAEQAALLASRLALNYLAGNINKSERYVWVGDGTNLDKSIPQNSLYDGVPPLSIQKYFHEKNSGCECCT